MLFSFDATCTSLLITLCVIKLKETSSLQRRLYIIIIMAGMAAFKVAGYLIEERRRWPVITASPRGQSSK